jgi:hypothetical protein
MGYQELFGSVCGQINQGVDLPMQEFDDKR